MQQLEEHKHGFNPRGEVCASGMFRRCFTGGEGSAAGLRDYIAPERRADRQQFHRLVRSGTCRGAATAVAFGQLNHADPRTDELDIFVHFLGAASVCDGNDFLAFWFLGTGLVHRIFGVVGSSCIVHLGTTVSKKQEDLR
jgi:hypothetical protein